jgi:hypothetical protein
MLEKDLLKLVTDWLTLHRVMWWRQNVMGVRITRGGKDHFYRTGFPGLPDLFAVHRSVCYGIELKAGSNFQSQAQKSFQTEFEKAGGRYILARRLEEVVEGMR